MISTAPFTSTVSSGIFLANLLRLLSLQNFSKIFL